jgi:hypothetical protein
VERQIDYRENDSNFISVANGMIQGNMNELKNEDLAFLYNI